MRGLKLLESRGMCIVDDDKKKIIIYTDGGCEPNPGRGGYGVVMLYGKHRKELSQGYRLTTNNRMELLAVIKGVEALREPCAVKLYSDSKYIVNAMKEGWMRSWKMRGWRRKKNKEVINCDLWKTLDVLSRKHKIEFIWVKGHANVPLNERCDQLAENALNSSNLLIDEGYEKLSEKTIDSQYGLF